MAGVAAAIGAGALGLLSTAGNLGSTIYSTERNIANSNWQVQLQREFEERMANTQYQRAVADMKAAGLNPAAVGTGLGSNAVPTAAAATGNYGHTVGIDFSNLFSSAVSAAMAKDKNVTRQVLAEMHDETALQVQQMKNQGKIENEIQKKALGHSAYHAMDLEDKRAANAQLTEYWKQVHGHKSYNRP